MPVRPTHRTRRRGLLALVLAAALTVPAPALAVDTSTDTVGGIPAARDASRAAALPAVTIPAGVLWTGDGRSLWERNPARERAMASTTKIMTALVVLERADLADTVVVSESADRVGESEMGLRPGQRVSVVELLDGMLVHSANDAAFALAEHVGGSVDAFVGLMNEKARALGLQHTSFANPHGLDETGHHTSAADLATLSAVAMADPTFASIVGKAEVTLPLPGGGTKTWDNSNQLIGEYDGATGVKTGWTSKAGYCVVVSARRGDVELLGVVLGAKSERDRFKQARTLLDWGFEHYAVQQVSSADETAALVPVSDFLDVTVPAVVAETTSVAVFDIEGPVTTRVDVLPEVDAPVVAGQRLGTLSVVQGDRLLAQVPILAADAVDPPDAWEAAGIWFTRLWRQLFGGDLVAEPVPVM